MLTSKAETLLSDAPHLRYSTNLAFKHYKLGLVVQGKARILRSCGATQAVSCLTCIPQTGLALDKRSSLFFQKVSNEEKKTFYAIDDSCVSVTNDQRRY
jgi:hypothetical protein